MLWPILSEKSPIFLVLNFVRGSALITENNLKFLTFILALQVHVMCLYSYFNLRCRKAYMADKTARKCGFFVKKFTKLRCGPPLHKMNHEDKCWWYFQPSYGIATVKSQSNYKRFTGTRLPCSVHDFLPSFHITFLFLGDHSPCYQPSKKKLLGG